MNNKDRIRLGIALFFVFANVFVWQIVIAREKRDTLTVAFLNIGQGDGIFIEAPNGNQMMIDAGGGKIVLGELGKIMPFYDHSIDLLLVSNPDKDHIGGFIDVLNRYKVTTVIEPGTISESSTYKELERDIKKENAEKVIAEKGMQILLGEGVVFYVLFPDRDISGLDTNPGSIIGRLVFGKSSILFTGDTTQAVEKYLVTLDGAMLKSDILKVGHHGSRTSTSPELLRAVQPAYAVISAGVDNSYGHPHKETIDTLNKFKIPILGTYKEGRIIFKTDGETGWVRWD